ncbi:MAG TPA: hypothetical protein VK034_25990, partial [Enhygromyxa sp.]|nr:hypothetical protein [Enhygromyxa sp.]
PLLRRTSRSRAERRATPAILGLRVIAIAALVAMVLELAVRVETFTGAARRVVVLVDRSASMDLADSPAEAEPGRDTTRRFDRVRTLWREGATARERWREGSVDVEVRGFADEVTPLTRASADELALTPDGAASDLARALVELDESNVGDGAPLAGVVVISDGLVSADPATSRHLGTIVDALAVPVTTVAAGAPTIRDVAVAELHVGEFAFVENVTEFAAELISHGLAGKVAEVTLSRNGEDVASERVRLGSDGERRTIRFEVAPDRTGQFVYQIRVAPLDGEASVANNHRSFIVKVLRDKVRVLHVAGRPDWDVRALRTLLKRDPNVELLSYYILRDWEDTARDDGTAPLSLIAFPTDELFREQLGSFDLIVMHNFDAAAHGDYLGNVADYVREGGSLVVIGGDLGVASGDFAIPSFVELMPINLAVPAGLDREPFEPRLTESGRRHPITAWLAETRSARDRWSRAQPDEIGPRGGPKDRAGPESRAREEGTDWSGLPKLDSFNPADYGRNADSIGVAALLVHPGRTTRDGKPMPLLAVAEPGNGRVMTLSTGATWRLGFAPDLPLIDGARPYDLLWLGAVRWLLRDASAERLVLEIDQAEHAIGDPVELSIRTLSASYAPEPEVAVEYDIRSLAPEHADGPPVAEGRLVTDGLGRASARVEDLPAGAYQAEAWRADAPPQRGEDAPELGQAASRVFLIGGGGRELARVDADPGTKLLRELADRSGGEFIEAVEDEDLPDRLPMRDLDELDRVADGRRDLPLWDGWLALLIAIGAFGGEWIIRRRVGKR